MTTMLKQRHIY